MNYITKEETEKKELVSKFTITNGTLEFDENTTFKAEFNVGDIEAYKTDSTKIWIVSFIDEEEISVTWADDSETVEEQANLIVVPPTKGLELLKDSSLINLWETLSNGKSEDFDLKCIYIGDEVINEVPFIKAFKNTNTILDKKFKRGFTLYRKFGASQIFRTNLYTICQGKACLDTSRYVYYLLEANVIYYLGIDMKDHDLAVYLYNR